ncbi:CASP8-associated protein 2 isoform 1-T2 [Clarias gariepinus]|uniref:CASP8-associated protein 2 n=1 Tax=Clarias gariepinus TaxID=13013 RepID=UPI00234CD3E1|nr:CASP8-associated protein 2 [Clarias gariepinus]XP_053341621.1 CASP8-associated protein 2 [Clarias gariepinus]
MEMNAIDELYGDLGQGHPASVLNYDEDSVDIYSGLEDSPSKNKNNSKAGSFPSPNAVKESFDLYEELITEEQEEKDATYNELKSKFVAAQNQVQDLLAKLQQMQTKNSSLHQENTLLKKNICALIKTAKMEIVRKDEEISKLSKRSSWGGFHPYARERRQDASSRRLPGLNSPVGPVKESQDLKKDKVLSAEVSQRRTLNQPGDSSSMAAAPALSVVLRTCNHESPLNSANDDSRSLDYPPSAVAQEHRPVQSHRERESTSSNSETSTRQNTCDETDNRKEEKPSGKESTLREQGVSEKSQTKMHKNRLETEQRESAKGSCGSESNKHQQHDDPVSLRRSGRSRSPASSSSSTSEPSRSNADTQSRKEELRHKRGPERQSRHAEMSNGRSEKSSSDKSQRTTDKRETREQHRKEDRRQEDTRKRIRSDKEYEYKKTHSEERHKSDEKNSNRAERRSTRSETGKEHERQSAKDLSAGRGVGHKADKIRSDDAKDRSRTDVRENRRHASPVKPHRSAQNQRKDQDDKRRTSGRTVQEESSRSKASSRGDSGANSHLDSAKESVKGKGSGRGDKDKQIAKDKGSKTSPDNARNPNMNEGKSAQGDVHASAGRKSPPRLSSNSDGLPITEESSPKRKLSFMETLNLTVSPIKKHHNSEQVDEAAVSEQPSHPEDTLVSDLATERSLFEVGEEFCVIDEIEDDTLALPANPATQPCDKEPPASLEVREPELPKRIDDDLSETPSGKASGTDSEMQEDESVTRGDAADVCSTSDSQKSVAAISKVSLLFESAKSVASPTAPLTDDSQASAKKDKEIRRIDGDDPSKNVQTNNKPEASIQNEKSQQEVNTSVMETAPTSTCSNMDSTVSLEVVSSTVTVENNQETSTGLDTDITQSPENLDPCPGPLVEPSAETININSTAQEEIVPPEQASSSEPDSTENEMEVISRPSQSVAVPHDEDSMMLTLSNIKVIPEAISPLTSPVRQVKKSQQQRLGKEMHVKSLSKDFSMSASVADKDAVKMDMNKENKRPDSIAKPSLPKDQQEALSSTATEEDLEEGEIISESEGEGALVIQSPPNEIRSGLRCSPRSPGLQKKSQIRPAVPPARKEQEKNNASKGSPSSNKRRFKTVTVPPKAKISSCADFMNMLSFIRSELRRKYMKLHKNVTKPAFCCIIEMSQASFTEFVDSVNFHKFCCQGNEVKSRLNKIICSVTSKVSNNGIVNRIFEQRAEDLKQKLWNFVDGQFDFLFKELKAALKSDPGLSKNKPCLEGKQSNANIKEALNADLCRIQPKEPLSTTENRPEKKIESEGQKVQEKISSLISVTCRGLGSSGKNIKATMEEGPNAPELPTNNQSNQLQEVSSSEKSLQEVLPVNENRTSCYTRRLSHSGSTHDRSDFEILTEQQASSLTFNLVSDSQMGDIFRCLLQGSDLLESVDNHSWPLNTPRKDCQAGTSLIGIMTPSKMITPQKLLTSWTSISPYKYQMPLNPALLDENCMLEVPSNSSVQTVTTVTSHQPFSILAEDLAVSLTIPSPLKSDGHLSFLHPANEQQLCTPATIISAHYCEDALLDGEDATEQDIHLSLETDNSSSPSTVSGNWGAPDPAVFQFKPNLPMQAEVTEKSNDHFIVRIRHTSLGVEEEPQQERKETPPAEDVLSSLQSEAMQTIAGQLQVISNERSEAEIPSINTSKDPATLPKTTENLIEQVDDNVAHDAATEVTAAADSEHGLKNSCHRVSRKRKKHHSAPKAKRSKREKSQDKPEKPKHKKRSKSSKDKNEKTPVKKIKTPSPQLSPNSLSAKNVIRKKGEVVVTWTREEDRDILVALKTKGASSKTFATLSSKLRKSQAQVEERFTQLMKLFKKKEKMET